MNAVALDSSRNSDYGSDFSDGEVEIVNRLLEGLHAAPTPSHTSLPLQDRVTSRNEPLQPPVTAAAVEGSAPAVLHLAKGPAAALSKRARSPTSLYVSWPRHRPPPELIQYPDLSRASAALDRESTPDALATDFSPKQATPDRAGLSPLQRFRTYPKKPLSVTDLSSGAWCELQHAYVLSRLPGGRKTRTAAMRGGSAVHQKLEDQVHTAVRVSIARKEEAFALRMWNIVQGLRTLRETGMTRELEVWGIIDGQVVNGVIDEVSYACPVDAHDPHMIEASSRDSATGTKEGGQTSLSKYFGPHNRLVYLMDVKTRASTKLPSGAALRPTRIQLFLYHRLLRDIAACKLDLAAIISRYGLDPEARFSDAFMAQIGSLHDDIFEDSDSDTDETLAPEPSADQDSSRAGIDPSPDPVPAVPQSSDSIKYRCLKQLVPLLQDEFALAFPQRAGSIGDLLAVQYRHRDDGRIVGTTSFRNDSQALDEYIAKNMDWWQGRREAQGVPIEETYKCGYCEFADSCEWRMEKEKEYHEKKRMEAAA